MNEVRPRQPRSTKTAALWGAVLAAALLAASWLLTPSSDEPLPVGEGANELCLPRSPDGEYTFGVEALSNKGPDAVTLTAVRLVGADGVELREAYVAPVGLTLLGARRGWPPPDPIPEGLEWSSRTPAAGSTVAAGEVKNLILHLTVSGDGRFDAVAVAYSDASRDYVFESITSVIFRPTCLS